jgi:hypothetical protein
VAPERSAIVGSHGEQLIWFGDLHPDPVFTDR